jgi:hypothetical protein
VFHKIENASGIAVVEGAVRKRQALRACEMELHIASFPSSQLLCNSQKPAAAIDTGNVVTGVSQGASDMAGTATDVENAKLARAVVRDGQIEGGYEFASNLRLGSRGELSGVIACAQFKNYLLEGVSENFKQKF